MFVENLVTCKQSTFSDLVEEGHGKAPSAKGPPADTSAMPATTEPIRLEHSSDAAESDGMFTFERRTLPYIQCSAYINLFKLDN